LAKSLFRAQASRIASPHVECGVADFIKETLNDGLGLALRFAISFQLLPPGRRT
jgi:hypothetical protein